MKVSKFAAIAAVAALIPAAANAEFRTAWGPDDNVPELMVTAAGEKVDTIEKWEKVRKPELLKIFQEEMYGVRPVERPADLQFVETAAPEVCFGGKAIRKRIRGVYTGPYGQGEMNFSVWIPKRDYPVAVFVHSSPRPAETAMDENHPKKGYWLPVKDIISRGYAVVAYCNADVALDHHQIDVPTNGVFSVYGPKDLRKRLPNEWGILSAWAWGMSRVVDWIEMEPLLNSKRIACVGLSRNGKASLVAGVMDERFSLVVSCCSGCGGAKLNHMICNESEKIGHLIGAPWKWFCGNFAKYVNQDRKDKLFFDQHQFLALVAPRLLYVSSASEDMWAGPRGEFASAKFATPVWELYGKPGLIADEFPRPDTPLHAGDIGYHLRYGVHDLTRYDWKCYMDFADGHAWHLKGK